MSNVMNPDGTHKLIAGYSHANGINERDQEIATLRARNAELEAELHATTEERDYWQMTAKKLTGIKAERDALTEALQRIKGGCEYDGEVIDRCSCGRKTGVAYAHTIATKALEGKP